MVLLRSLVAVLDEGGSSEGDEGVLTQTLHVWNRLL